MNHITENTPVVVGRMYPVLCAVMICSVWGGELLIPIYGPEHKDAQLGIDMKHYHVDGRFAQTAGFCGVDRDGKTNHIIGTVYDPDNRYNFKELRVVQLKCKRKNTGISPPELVFSGSAKYGVWCRSMIGKSCKGKKCPHLGTLMKERDGVLVCPLHDLHGCIESETIIPHPLDQVNTWLDKAGLLK